MLDYNNLALLHAEKYGIITYKVKNFYMIYNQNYYNKEFFNGKWTSKPCTYQRIVDLRTNTIQSKKLKRLQKDGWDNV